MTPTEIYPIIAIDGGGTRCRIALETGQEKMVVETGSANATTDFDRTLNEISAGLTTLATQADLALDAMRHIPAYVGLAGVTGPDIAQRLTAALPFEHIRVEDDRHAALRGALGEQDGFVAHCGTGSFFAAQLQGQPNITGGWGPVLGDIASAQWVGRNALSYTLDASDSLKPRSDMAEHLLATHGGTSGIVAFAASARPTDFGAIAPIVTTHAQNGDALATALLQDAAAHLVHTLTLMGWSQGLTICLTGGIGPHYADYLPDNMRSDVKAPQGEPLTGALSLAREFRKEVIRERC